MTPPPRPRSAPKTPELKEMTRAYTIYRNSIIAQANFFGRIIAPYASELCKLYGFL